MFCQMIEQTQKYAYRCRMEFLTTSEAAAYVRLGERKLYELVTSGAIPCSKVAGKWLFPRHELDLWVLSGLARPAGVTASDRWRQPGRSVGMELARIRIRACLAHRGHCARRRASAARRGDGRGDPLPQPCHSRRICWRRQCWRGARATGPA